MTKSADELRLMRLDKRLTQGEVARKLGVSQSHYSAIERGEKPRELTDAKLTISDMRLRTNRTGGGDMRVGKRK